VPWYAQVNQPCMVCTGVQGCTCKVVPVFEYIGAGVYCHLSTTVTLCAPGYCRHQCRSLNSCHPHRPQHHGHCCYGCRCWHCAAPHHAQHRCCLQQDRDALCPCCAGCHGQHQRQTLSACCRIAEFGKETDVTEGECMCHGMHRPTNPVWCAQVCKGAHAKWWQCSCILGQAYTVT
jgi:hypothetical protein